MSRHFKWVPLLSVATLSLGTVPAVYAAPAKIYVSVQQAQQLMYGAALFTPQPVILSTEVQKSMRDASSVSHPFDGSRIWKTESGKWFIVDEVVGKHEMITYALGLSAEGVVEHIEILEYRESYGYEVAVASWRGQFVGKTVQSKIKLNQDIENVSGATLSAKHLTDGIKRVLVMYELVLKTASRPTP